MSKRLAGAVLSAATLVGALIAAPMAAGSPSDRYSQRRDCGSDSSFSNPEFVGLTDDQRLICFDAGRPRSADDIGRVRGLDTDTKLVGIDVRPADGQLYGFGDQAGVYTINLRNGRATLVSRANVMGQPVVLQGTSFGVDFNPAADRLRIVSDAGQNLRINVVDGSTNTDGTLNYTPGTPALGVTGAAYTNNDADPNTATTLFDVDSTLDQVSIQSPPNNGSLVATGKLGVDTTPDVAVDIVSRVRQGTATDNDAYAALNSRRGSTFYEVDLLTGSVDEVGRFDFDNYVIGIAAVDTDR
jgi:Domain of unknown function (DUF4394)